MTNYSAQSLNYEDYMNTTAIFGEVKKNVISKSFKGGRISNMFGETKVYLANADVNGTAIVDISQLFGAVKVWVPANWHVIVDMSNFFAEVKDKRLRASQMVDDKKVLVLTGFSCFAEVKIYDCE